MHNNVLRKCWPKPDQLPTLHSMTLFQRLNGFLALVISAAVVFAASAPVAAQDDAVGYGGAKVQLQPLMVPTRTSDGRVQFEVLSMRLVLDAGPRERPACFSIPMVHEKLLMYLYSAKLTPADFVGQRRDVLAAKLLEVAIAATDKNYYSAVEILTESSQAMDPKSQTLTNQCK